jgi:hypothetical protein
MNTKDLVKLFDDVLAPAGFRRRQSTWYKGNEDTITLVNLQKSQWGGQYYVNLGVYLRALGNATSPPEHQAHIRTRLTSIGEAGTSGLNEALDLESTEITRVDRTNAITGTLATVAVPFLAERSSVERLRELHADGQLGPVMTMKAALELLDVGGAQ